MTAPTSAAIFVTKFAPVDLRTHHMTTESQPCTNHNDCHNWQLCMGQGAGAGLLSHIISTWRRQDAQGQGLLKHQACEDLLFVHASDYCCRCCVTSTLQYAKFYAKAELRPPSIAEFCAGSQIKRNTNKLGPTTLHVRRCPESANGDNL